MQIESSPYLLYAFQNIDKVLLILARVVGFVYLLPIFSGRNVQNRVKVGFCFIISVLIFSTGVANTVDITNINAVAYTVLISKEVLTGLAIGFVVYTIFTVTYFAGQMMDYSIGFSMVNVFDPVTQIQVPITGNLIYYVITVLFIISGGLHALLAIFFDSYNVLPIGSANLLIDSGFAEYLVILLGSYLSLGVRIAMPIVGTIMIVDVSLGLLVKASPQMNVFVVGMPIKLLVGLIIMSIICPYFIDVYNEMYFDMTEAVINVIGGLSH